MPNPSTIDAAQAAALEDQSRQNQPPKGPPVPTKLITIRRNVGFVVDGNRIIVYEAPFTLRSRAKAVIKGSNLNVYNQVLLRAGTSWYRPIDLRRAYGTSEPISFIVPNFNRILKDGDTIWIQLKSKSSPHATGVIAPYSQYSSKIEEEEREAEEDAKKGGKETGKGAAAEGAAPGPTAMALEAAGEVIGGIARSFIPKKTEVPQATTQAPSATTVASRQQKTATEEDYGDEGEYPVEEAITEAEEEVETATPVTTAQMGAGVAAVSGGTAAQTVTVGEGGGTVTGKETLGVSGTVTGKGTATVSGTAGAQVGGTVSSTISGTTQVGGAVSGGISGTVTGKEGVDIGGEASGTATVGTQAFGGGTTPAGMAFSIGRTAGTVRPPTAAAKVTSEAGRAAQTQAQAGYKPISGEQRQNLIDQSLSTIDSNFEQFVKTQAKANPQLTEEQLREAVKGRAIGDVGISGREPVKQLAAALQQIDGQPWGLKDEEIDWAIRKMPWGQLRKALIDAELGGEKIGDVIKRVLESNPLPGVTPTKTRPETVEVEEKVEVPPEIAAEIARLKKGNLPLPAGMAAPTAEGKGAIKAPPKTAALLPAGETEPETSLPSAEKPSTAPEEVPAGVPKESPAGSLPATVPSEEKPTEEAAPMETPPPGATEMPPSTPLRSPLERKPRPLGADSRTPSEMISEALKKGYVRPDRGILPTIQRLLDKKSHLAEKGIGKASQRIWYIGLSNSSAVLFSGLDFFAGALIMDAYWIFGHKKDKLLFPLKAWQKAVTVFANIAPLLYALFFLILIFIAGCNFPPDPSPSVFRALGYGNVCDALNSKVANMVSSSVETPSYPSGPCAPLYSGPASVNNLTASCFGSNAVKASAIASAESGGNPLRASSVDKCEPGGEVVSWGLFQINLSAHRIGGLNCPAAFDRMYTGTNHQCRIVNQSLYNSCVQAAKEAQNNIEVACRISGNGTNWSAWGANRRCGF